MRRLPLLASLATLLVTCSVAHADTFLTYDFNATFTTYGNGSAAGTIVLDTTTGTFTSGNVVANVFGPELLNYVPPTNSAPDFSIGKGPGYFYTQIYFSTSVTSFVNYTGSTIPLTLTEYSTDLGGIISNAATASLTLEPQVAATPEPSSIVLLGTGILGVATTLRKRLF